MEIASNAKNTWHGKCNACRKNTPFGHELSLKTAPSILPRLRQRGRTPTGRRLPPQQRKSRDCLLLVSCSADLPRGCVWGTRSFLDVLPHPTATALDGTVVVDVLRDSNAATTERLASCSTAAPTSNGGPRCDPMVSRKWGGAYRA